MAPRGAPRTAPATLINGLVKINGMLTEHDIEPTCKQLLLGKDHRDAQEQYEEWLHPCSPQLLGAYICRCARQTVINEKETITSAYLIARDGINTWP